jgi:DNA-binding NarL/FixJ family response regulator
MVKGPVNSDDRCVLVTFPDAPPNVATRPVRVFLCDDVPEFRALLRLALEGDEQLTVVGEAGDGDACVAGVSATRADVLLLDLSMPRRDGLEAIPMLRSTAPDCAIVVLSGFDAHWLGPQVIGAGAASYVEKGESFETIRRAVREAGRSMTAPAVAA